MRIVDMDGDLLREIVDVEPRLLVMAHDALHASGDEEVLLDKTHAAPVIGAVVRIEELRDGLDELTVLALLFALLLCEHAVIGEIMIDLRIPEAQRVDRTVMIADDRHIVGHSHDCERILIDDLKRPIVHLLHIGIAVELDIDGLIRFAILPGETILEPVIRDLNLVAVDDLLLEEAVLVTDAAAMSRQTVRRHRVDEAGREASEAAVAKTGIRLLLIRLTQVDLETSEHILYSILDAEVHEVRLQQAADQELDGEIVDLLLSPFHVRAVRLDPILRNELLGCRSDGLVDFVLGELVDLPPPHHMRGIDETAAERLLERLILSILANVLFLPCQIKHSPLADTKNVEDRQEPYLPAAHVFRLPRFSSQSKGNSALL